MWKLEKPVRAAGPTYATCISRVNAGLKARLDAVKQDIVDASNAFETAADTASLHTLPHPSLVGGDITKTEMVAVYTDRFAKKGSAGRHIYDELFTAPRHGRCPLCGERSVSTLDHHLPKAHYIALAVAPLNLVPACFDCNRAKLEMVPQCSEEETLHPYFDDVENELWVKALVLQMAPAALRFFVEPPDNWDILKSDRVRHHFKTLRLAALYAAVSAEELSNIRYELSGLYDKGGTEFVREHLLDRAESCRRNHVNSWQTATYAAISNDAWFCGGGFA